MFKRFIHLCSFVIVTLLLCSCIANASDIMPVADSEFAATTVFLKTTKEVTFRATTYDLKDKLSVTACSLEQKNDNGSWSTVCSLPAPGTIAEDDFSCYVTVSYSSYIGSGTFRVRATFDADGHTVSVYSNERTF